MKSWWKLNFFMAATKTICYLSDAAKGPISIRGTQGNVSATHADGGSHSNGHQEGGGSLPWLNAVTLRITPTKIQHQALHSKSSTTTIKKTVALKFKHLKQLEHVG